MTIIINTEDEKGLYGLTPPYIYKKLCNEYYDRVVERFGNNFWGAISCCDECARSNYSQRKKRPSKVKSLILTYKDAEECFKLFSKFLDLWADEFQRE